MIPAASPQLRFARFSAGLDRAVQSVLAGPNFILGERAETFEQRFASYVGVAHCVGVNSGTDAVGLALRACGVGTAAAFSFYPTKNLGCAGDGGAVVTNEGAVAQRLRALRSYGWQDERRVSAGIGFNSRLDELQAAVLDVMLDHLDEGNRE